MGEVGIDNIRKNGTEMLVADRLQKEAEEAWNNEDNWKEGKDVSLEINELPLGTHVIELPSGERILKAVLPGGPHDETDKRNPMRVPVAVFNKGGKRKYITQRAKDIFHHALRGNVKFTGKAPTHG